MTLMFTVFVNIDMKYVVVFFILAKTLTKFIYCSVKRLPGLRKEICNYFFIVN